LLDRLEETQKEADPSPDLKEEVETERKTLGQDYKQRQAYEAVYSSAEAARAAGR
jgi:hypothetical protein